MGKPILEVKGVSKRYNKALKKRTTLKQELKNWWKPETDQNANYLWALNDVSFTLQQGDVLGFIGSNGAGKSTLLKIISKIVKPTTGFVRGTGRIGSLLEVGTGFHPELTGRENIFLNGTILGMKRKDVLAKFDEIVDFSGVETFMDTPVKRYSSGMYMRLAFSVAAHLDSEILLIDEILAVGDIDFQQKCFRKIMEVSEKEGRTIIFVSHNIQAVRTLCNISLYLNQGRIESFGETDDVINSYITKSDAFLRCQDFTDLEIQPGNEHISIQRIAVGPYNKEKNDRISTATSILLSIKFWFRQNQFPSVSVSILVFNFSGECIFNISSGSSTAQNQLISATCVIPANFLNDGSYYIDLQFLHKNRIIYEFNRCLSFHVEDKPLNSPDLIKPLGYIRPDFSVVLESIL
jgi:lipopolysaccharide transport system ATP-binding protein